ncbi:type III pantothenate kinase [Candidatus Saganbacteria bacterium]|nr:type III pantothenate kinase [Candidatus Saganbacteria bacterium]
MRLLAIDIGNTSTVFGLFKGAKLKKKWRVPTEKLAGRVKKNNFPVVVSSVVPQADKIIKKQLPQAHFVTASNIKGIKIKIKIRNKAEVGADRVVNALAALRLYGKPAIIVDFGTATTFDALSSKGEYLGGAIAPGIALTRDILHERTAKLPKVKIAPPQKVIGDSTVGALKSGLVYGYAALVEGMIVRFKDQLGEKTKVIATGGYAELIGKYARGIDIIDQDLTLKGLMECLKN